MNLLNEIKKQVGYVDTIIWAPCAGNEGIEKNKKYEAVVLLKDIEKIFADRASEVGVEPEVKQLLAELLPSDLPQPQTCYDIENAIPYWLRIHFAGDTIHFILSKINKKRERESSTQKPDYIALSSEEQKMIYEYFKKVHYGK